MPRRSASYYDLADLLEHLPVDTRDSDRPDEVRAAPRAFPGIVSGRNGANFRRPCIHRRLADRRCEKSNRKIVNAPHVVTQHVATPLRVADLVAELLDFLDVISGVVGMREVGGPEEAIAAAQIDHRGQ